MHHLTEPVGQQHGILIRRDAGLSDVTGRLLYRQWKVPEQVGD
jgi:hypothetical protein